MRRILIAGEDTRSTAQMIGRARAACARVDDGRSTEIVIVTDDSPATRRWASLVAPDLRRVAVGRATSVAARLDAGWLLRPLPDELIVVGSDPRCSPAELHGLLQVLRLDPRIGIAALGVTGAIDADTVVRHGAAVRPGALGQAGGFDTEGPLTERMWAVGAEVASFAPLREIAALEPAVLAS